MDDAQGGAAPRSAGTSICLRRPYCPGSSRGAQPCAAFAELTAAQCHTALKGRARVELDDFDCLEAAKISEGFTEKGLRLEATPVDASGYLPRNDVTGLALMIEDNDLAKAVCERAIAGSGRDEVEPLRATWNR